MHIKDFMITDTIYATKETTLEELLETLVNNKIGGVPVLDENHKLLGMVTDGDVIRYLQPKGRTVYDIFSMVLVNEKEDLEAKLNYTIHDTVEKIMRRKEICTVHEDDDLEKALLIFSKNRFKKIPVLNNEEKVVGVVSRGDLIRFISTKLISSKK
ncbi:CBS domain-containing protein [Oceanobacillus halotolerans]|uniref:CBS domain-containing protein n=1 Tax=Oceanobacillus halotolerans TaxID=2663380 RepID=UPI0013DC6207|nr:CBS domain-containing protein [Oceanobacillus halotolerans]